MPTQKQSRRRGVILTPVGLKKLRSAIQQQEDRDNFGTKYTLVALSERIHLDPVTIAKILEAEAGVDKRTLEQCFRAFELELDKVDYTQPVPQVTQRQQALFEPKQKGNANSHQDLREAVDVSVFYGRNQELATLEQWIRNENCRVVALLGMGGIGKTALAAKLVASIGNQFDFVIWKTLRNAPPVHEVLEHLLQFVSQEQETQLPDSFDSRIKRLIDYLRSSRILVVLDNVETILLSGSCAGKYREGYEGYGELLLRVGEVAHSSCVILTSREKALELTLLAGEHLPVRCLQLMGLNLAPGRELFRLKGFFSGTESEWKAVIQHYGGNPLALKIVAGTTLELFEGHLGQLLEWISQSPVVFNDIRQLLCGQFSRLSELEAHLMYWLAIEREPVSVFDLQENVVYPVSPTSLLEALRSLLQRSLIEKTAPTPIEISADRFTLQPVVMEYVTSQLTAQVCQEIETQQLALFKSLALMKATSLDYVRQTQVRLILKPVIDELLRVVGSPRNIENQLNKILAVLREQPSLALGYTGGNILNLLGQLKTDLRGYDFSALSVWQADLRRMNLSEVNFKNADLTKSVFTEAFSGILAVAFNPDGGLLAIGDTQGEIGLWQIADSQRYMTYKGHVARVTAVAFSPDGRLLASSSTDCTVKLWNVSTGQCLQTLQGHSEAIWSISFSPDSQILASGSNDYSTKLWDVTTGECVRTWQEHSSFVRAVAFSPDGSILASGSFDQTIRLWDVSTGKCRHILQGHSSGVSAIAYAPSVGSANSPPGMTLASSSHDKTVRLWDVNTGQCQKTLQGHSQRIWSVAFSPDGQKLASGSDDRTVKLWDASTGQCLRTLLGHSGRIWSVAFSPDGSTLGSGSMDTTVNLWEVDTGRCQKTWHGFSNPFWSVAYAPSAGSANSPDGQMLACSSADCQVRLWDVRRRQYCQTFRGHDNWVRFVTFCPVGVSLPSGIGQLLASGSDDQTVKLWDVTTGQCLHTLYGHSERVWSVSFSPTGKLLASSSDDHSIKVWDSSDGRCVQTLHGHSNGILSVTFNPQGTMLASGSDDYSIKLWQLSDGSCLQTWYGHENWVWSVAFSPDGSLLASASVDQTVRLWNISDGKCVQILRGHSDWVRSVTFSPDGQTLASGSYDQTVRLWQLATGQCQQILQGHSNRVRLVAFSPDSQILVSSSEDETIKFWDVKTGECFETLRSERPYEGMNITGAKGLTQPTKATLRALGAVEH